MSDVAIRVSNLGKKYVIGHQRQAGPRKYVALRDVITHTVANGIQRIAHPKGSEPNPTREEFWAVKDVSFEIKRGEAVGIIGRNGAGKSTLLKMLSRITDPTCGRIEINGKVASLLEVGTGFHPELTGRENIYLNGAILGMTRAEIKSRFDEIVAFAEVEKFIDTPVKHFSSGMYVRLAFAVAAHLEPDILVVDEVLAVGDAQFQKKSLGKMQSVVQRGQTILFVSHNMAAIRAFCQKGFLLDRGALIESGDIHQVVEKYSMLGNDFRVEATDLETRARPAYVDGRARFVRLEVNDRKPVYHGEPFILELEARLESSVGDLAVCFGFSAVDGTRFLSYDSDLQQQRIGLEGKQRLKVRVVIDELLLQPGIYSLDIGLRSGNVIPLDYLPSCIQIEVLAGPRTPPFIVNGMPGVRAGALWKIETGTKSIEINSRSGSGLPGSA